MAMPSTPACPTTEPTTRNGRDHFATVGARDTSTHALPAAEDPPLHAVHTPNLPALFRHLGASLLVTTYQAGKLLPQPLRHAARVTQDPSAPEEMLR
jgi:hypothetical protein